MSDYFHCICKQFSNKSLLYEPSKKFEVGLLKLGTRTVNESTQNQSEDNLYLNFLTRIWACSGRQKHQENWRLYNEHNQLSWGGRMCRTVASGLKYKWSLLNIFKLSETSPLPAYLGSQLQFPVPLDISRSFDICWYICHPYCSAS